MREPLRLFVEAYSDEPDYLNQAVPLTKPGDRKTILAHAAAAASVSLHDADNKKWLGLGMTPSGEASLFIGQNGPSSELPTTGPSVKLAIQEGKPCLLFGMDNRVVWSAL